MRVEYMRTLASAHRWPEEVNLLCEEMARTLTFLTYEEAVWLQRVLSASHGQRAFALRQSRERRRLRAHFEQRWSVFNDSKALDVALRARETRKLQRKKANVDASADEGVLEGGRSGEKDVEEDNGDDVDEAE